ncbi:hypothetical protein [Phenylobacterium sp.]|jgi:hypothetical protein|uniref:hypothetical protein n=1 Tax=Phenylobacterium sp. TaxID=1871053 RepID=UPI002E36EF40|nr:hypothetical protein [Phenylobacterium sp.]HEX2559574.1 hypothetical protein [Phenylobacterium sp.]
MSEAAAPGRAQPFSTKVVVALLLVGLVAFAGFTVLAAYAPEMRGSGDPGAHALSRSAVGYTGVRALLEEQRVDAVVSRSFPPHDADYSEEAVPLVVVTPPRGAKAKDLEPFFTVTPLLIVLPKWLTAPDPVRSERVLKLGVGPAAPFGEMLKGLSAQTTIASRKGWSSPVLIGAGDFEGARLPLGRIDSLQTISGPGWDPVLVDESGAAVLACAKSRRVCVLADPDLLNTQGIASRDTARAGLAILNTLRGEGGPVYFDVTLNGLSADHNLLKLLLTPPLLSFTLCAVAAALLMGWHAMARFGPAAREDRELALGKQALVDNSAGLFRMAGKEHELAPAYVRLTEQLAARSAGGERAPHGTGERIAWLDRMAAQRGITTRLAELEREAEGARTRHDLLGLARRLYEWRAEMTRERR